MEAELQAPLLGRVSSHVDGHGFILDVTSPASMTPDHPRPTFASVDVFRGLCIVAMMVTNSLGETFPALGYAPWNGVRMGDVALPCLVFAVGVDVAITFRWSCPKFPAACQIVARAAKLFLLGLFLDGGFLHGSGDLSVGVSITGIRILGTLQCVALVYLVVALSHLAVSRQHGHGTTGDGEGECCGLCSVLVYHWQAGILVAVLYLCLTLLLYVPDWQLPVPLALGPATVTSLSAGSSLPNAAAPAWEPVGPNNVSSLMVTCGFTGDLSPSCNAAAYIDRTLLGLAHLYQLPTYRNLPECSLGSTAAAAAAATDSSGADLGVPAWCLAPFEPEGILSTLGALLTAFLGLHCGYVLARCQAHVSRLIHALPFGVLLLLGGWAAQHPFQLSLHDILPFDSIPPSAAIIYPGMPLNRSLYSISFALLVSGASCILLLALFVLVDIAGVGFYTRLLEWAGRNSLLLYVLAVTPLSGTLVAGFYWGQPENNLNKAVQRLLMWLLASTTSAHVAGTCLRVLFWTLAAGLLCSHDIALPI